MQIGDKVKFIGTRADLVKAFVNNALIDYILNKNPLMTVVNYDTYDFLNVKVMIDDILHCVWVNDETLTQYDLPVQEEPKSKRGKKKC